MREIVFRGKICRDCKGVTTQKKYKKGDWAFGDLSHTNYNSPLIDQNNDDPVPVDPATVGQYTGLQDSNGKRIFEGDIVRMHGNPDDIAEICFGEFGCVDIELEAKTDRVHGWYYKPLKTDAMSQVEPFCWEFQINDMWIKGTEMVVVGNIHDNPELMEGQG